MGRLHAFIHCTNESFAHVFQVSLVSIQHVSHPLHGACGKNRDLEWTNALSGKREPDTEGAAFARRALGSDAAHELLHQGLCNRETQSRPLA
jgi:hypothetical protein